MNARESAARNDARDAIFQLLVASDMPWTSSRSKVRQTAEMIADWMADQCCFVE